ncbi:MAG: tRNA pseudouridine(38-40) synthase TruA [Bacteroidota bacterium]
MEKNYRYFIYLSYLGINFKGWQKQPGTLTVQQKLEESLSILLKTPTEVTGTGRTDTEVHARKYTAHFDYSSLLSGEEKAQLCFKLNRILPPDISIEKIVRVKSDAHARFSAIKRSYEYCICRRKDPFLIKRAWQVEWPLNFESMQQASQILMEYSDFESFSKSNTQVNNYLCTITQSGWEKRGHLWVYKISSNRFLRNMIRAIVGTLADVGSEKVGLEDFRKIIESKDRKNAGYSVPGYGLYFLGAEYDEEIFEES